MLSFIQQNLLVYILCIILIYGRFYLVINYILLAISVSIDSLGIGITYGIRNTKIYFFSKIILFIISVFITSLAVFIGGLICTILPSSFANYIGIFILVFLGIWIIYQSFDKENKNNIRNDEGVILRPYGKHITNCRGEHCSSEIYLI